MSEAPHLVERPRPPAPTRNAVHLVGYVRSDPEMEAADVVLLRVATPDPVAVGAHDVHRVLCSGETAKTAWKLERGALVAVLGSLHYGARRVHVWARTIERAPDTETKGRDVLATRLAAHVEEDPHHDVARPGWPRPRTPTEDPR